MLCAEIVSDIQNNFCTQHVLPMVCKKKRASDKNLPVCRQKWVGIESGLNFESVVATQLEKFKQEPIMLESSL